MWKAEKITKNLISWNFQKNFSWRLSVIKRYNFFLSSCQILSSLANGKGRGRGNDSLTSEGPNILINQARSLNCTSPLGVRGLPEGSIHKLRTPKKISFSTPTPFYAPLRFDLRWTPSPSQLQLCAMKIIELLLQK